MLGSNTRFLEVRQARVASVLIWDKALRTGGDIF